MVISFLSPRRGSRLHQLHNPNYHLLAGSWLLIKFGTAGFAVPAACLGAGIHLPEPGGGNGVEKGWGCRGAQCHVYSLSLQLPGAACCAFPARRAPLISAKGSKMEVIGITLFFNYFLSDAFILALKICVCMKKKLFLLCSEIQRKLHQRCPLHKGFPPRIPRCLPAHLSFLARFSSKFCFFGGCVLPGAAFRALWGDFCCSHPHSHPWLLGDPRGPITHRSPLALSLCIPAPLPMLFHHFAPFRAQSARITASLSSQLQ